MDWSRKWKLIWRWSLLTSAPIALYWGIWYLAHGSVPSQALREPNALALIFPHAVSRWLDVAIGPICAAATILLVTSKKMSDKQVPSVLGMGALLGGLFSALLGTSPLGTPEGTVIVLAIIASLLGMVAALFKGITVLWAVLGAALASGVGFGLAYGILIGAGCVFLIWGVGGIGVLLGAGIRKIFQTLTSKTTWQSVGRWLTAK